jgi:hypothetical protein
MKVYNRIADYMMILNLCSSQEIITPHDLISELKIIKKEFKYNFSEYEFYIISEYNI